MAVKTDVKSFDGASQTSAQAWKIPDSWDGDERGLSNPFLKAPMQT